MIKSKDFLLLLSGRAVSNLGTQAMMIAHAYWVKQLTNSNFWVGIAMMMWFLPSVILGPFAGVLADRRSRKSIMVMTDMISGISILTVLGIIQYSNNDTVTLFSLLAIAALMSCCSAFFHPASSAIVSDILPKKLVGKGLSLLYSSDSLIKVIATSVGGLLITIVGGPILLLIDGISYILSSLFEMFLADYHKADSRQLTTKQVTNDIRAGLALIWRNKALRNALLTGLVINIFTSPIFVIMPFYTDYHLHLSPAWYGYSMSSLSAGLLIGSLLNGRIRIDAQLTARIVPAILIIMWLPIFALSLISNAPSLLVLVFALGFCIAFVNLRTVAHIHETAEQAFKGRIFSSMKTLSAAATPLAMGCAGLLGDLLPKKQVNLAYAILGLLGIGASTLLAKKFSTFFLLTSLHEN